MNSTNIADYNSFVNTQAGGATYNGSVVSWDAIGSTPTVNAIDNIGQQPIAGVYLANGTLSHHRPTTTGPLVRYLLAPINQDLSGINYKTTRFGLAPRPQAPPHRRVTRRPAT